MLVHYKVSTTGIEREFTVKIFYGLVRDDYFVLYFRMTVIMSQDQSRVFL